MQGRGPYAALAVAVVGVSFASIFIRLSESPAMVKATYRVGLASLILLPVVLGWYRRETFSLSRRELLLLSLVGAILATHFATWFASLDHTSVASSVILVNTHPLAVAIFSHHLFKERVSWVGASGVLLGFAGILIIFYGDLAQGGGILGDGLALIGGAMTAAYLLSGRRLRQRVPLAPYVFVVYATCSLFLLGATIVLGFDLRPAGEVPRELLLFLGLAVVSTILGHTLYNWSLRHLPAPVVSTSLLGEPVGATLLALALLAEAPNFAVVLGGALALVGIYLAAMGTRGG